MNDLKRISLFLILEVVASLGLIIALYPLYGAGSRTGIDENWAYFTFVVGLCLLIFLISSITFFFFLFKDVKIEKSHFLWFSIISTVIGFLVLAYSALCGGLLYNMWQAISQTIIGSIFGLSLIVIPWVLYSKKENKEKSLAEK